MMKEWDVIVSLEDGEQIKVAGPVIAETPAKVRSQVEIWGQGSLVREAGQKVNVDSNGCPHCGYSDPAGLQSDTCPGCGERR